MKILKTSLFIAFILFCSTALFADTPPAESVAPTQAQLEKLLRGNSICGKWADSPYQQYFNADGSTNYQELGTVPSVGSWSTSATGQYCSIWPPSSYQSCYTLRVNEKDIYWKTGDTYYKASVINGNIFTEQQSQVTKARCDLYAN